MIRIDIKNVQQRFGCAKHSEIKIRLLEYNSSLRLIIIFYLFVRRFLIVDPQSCDAFNVRKKKKIL